MARNRNRQSGPIRRTIIDAPPAPTVGTNPALRRPATLAVVTGPGPRRPRATGGGMPSGDGQGISLWHQPADLPYSISRVSADRRWDLTASTARI